MCVTNTTQRRSPAISLSAAKLSSSLGELVSSSLIGTVPASLGQKNAGHVFVPPAVGTSFANPSKDEKPRPKRRRKPQKPGKTAKLNDRHFVVHNYHDHACDRDEGECAIEETTVKRRGGVGIAFPLKLHAVLDQVEADGLSHVVSWQIHGRCFVIHKPKEFVEYIMPNYFRQTKLTSFQRQLNLYGFSRITRGQDAGGYYHELFLKGKSFLCKQMHRVKVKGTKFKAASSPDQEPDFYAMSYVSPTCSSDEDGSQGSGCGNSVSGHNYSHVKDPAPPASVLSSLVKAFPVCTQPVNRAHGAIQQPTSRSFSGIIYPSSQGSTDVDQAVAVQSLCLKQCNEATKVNPPGADPVLDQAVDELFMDGTSEKDACLADFVSDWEPHPDTFSASLEDDMNLGYMLDKLLQDE